MHLCRFSILFVYNFRNQGACARAVRYRNRGWKPNCYSIMNTNEFVLKSRGKQMRIYGTYQEITEAKKDKLQYCCCTDGTIGTSTFKINRISVLYTYYFMRLSTVSGH